jgi:hypothetical protein
VVNQLAPSNSEGRFVINDYKNQDYNQDKGVKIFAFLLKKFDHDLSSSISLLLRYETRSTPQNDSILLPKGGSACPNTST